MTEILSVIQKEIAALASSLTEDDLDRLRNKVRTAATVGGERPGDRMQRLGRSWVALGRYESLDDEVDRIGRVTLQELRSVAEQFPLTPATIGVLAPATAS